MYGSKTFFFRKFVIAAKLQLISLFFIDNYLPALNIAYPYLSRHFEGSKFDKVAVETCSFVEHFY